MAANRIIINKSALDNISNAIRNKLDNENQYALDEMPGAIRSIETGGGGGDGYIHIINPVIRVGNVTDGTVAITVTEVIPAE